MACVSQLILGCAYSWLAHGTRVTRYQVAGFSQPLNARLLLQEASGDVDGGQGSGLRGMSEDPSVKEERSCETSHPEGWLFPACCSSSEVLVRCQRACKCDAAWAAISSTRHRPSHGKQSAGDGGLYKTAGPTLRYQIEYRSDAGRTARVVTGMPGHHS
jgi:hypothetical protein